MVPGELRRFQTLTERALEQGERPGFLAADSGYEESGEFREFLRKKNLPYALQISPDDIRVVDASVKTVPPGNGRRRDTFPEGMPVLPAKNIADSTKDWEMVAWTEGTKGKMSGLSTHRMVRIVENSQMRYTTDEVCWLLLERIEKRSHKELKAYLCWGMDSASDGLWSSSIGTRSSCSAPTASKGDRGRDGITTYQSCYSHSHS
ncbi:MAG: transposase [Candidatus Thermoplasmatota archaeon]|nr:transposase [Candidatus Thermoplasmatota archaeon]MCL5253397.1 transposase [Candidatus Thermoplasmatota archaeon]